MLENLRRRSSSPTSLLDIIAQVRTRWRMKLALRGALSVAGIAFGLFLLAAYGMEWARFSGASIIAARVAMLVVLAASAYWFLVRAAAAPGHRRAGGALSRRARAVAAGDAAERGRDEPERARAGIGGAGAARRRAGDRSVRAHGRVAPRGAAAAAPLRRVARPRSRWSRCWRSWLGPAFLRNAMSAMLLVSSNVQAASPYRIEVTPGNITVPKGVGPDGHGEAAMGSTRKTSR